jgi:hypothetical protein
VLANTFTVMPGDLLPSRRSVPVIVDQSGDGLVETLLASHSLVAIAIGLFLWQLTIFRT